MAVEISQPFRVFTDVDGEPLEDGFIHIGAVNQNPQVVPISVFWDVALTIPAPQPIRTLGGYPSRTGTPSRMYVAEAEYSISVSNKNSTLIYSSLDSDNPLAETGSPSNGAALIARGDQIVNSITELRALLKTSASKFAFVNGYYVAGDGGGGQYYLDVIDTTSADNGGTIIVANDGARWKLFYSDYVTVKQFGAKGDGATDDGPVLRKALAAGVPLFWPSGTYITAFDPASAFDDGGTTRYSWSLKIPSGATLIFEAGAIIKQANGVQSWTRTVSLQDASNVRIFGELRVDANVANHGTPTNEHMHGVFIFNTLDCYIERINSQNARGDNVFIGGTSESTISSRVNIGSIYAKAAGRKNLVLQHFNNITIGSAVLDNSTGGAALYGGVADNTDKHSLDVEPDAFTGGFLHEAWIGRLHTFGLGNDFTAGTTPAHADACVINIDTATCIQSGASSTVPAWQQNAITVNVGSLSVTGMAGIDNPMQLAYAARLTGDNLFIEGNTATSAGFILQAAVSGTDENRPKINFTKAQVKNINGGGLDFRSALASIGQCEVQCSGFGIQAGDNVSSASFQGSLTIDHLISRDTGVAATGAVLNCVTYNIGGYETSIKKATQYDTRGAKAGFFAQVESGNAAGLLIGELVSPESIPAVNWLSTDKYYRISGGKWTATPRAPAVFVCQGTPESMIPAAVGSTAMRLDGGALTSFYVKEAGVGTTGWVGK